MFTRNFLDQPFFSGMKMERNIGDEAEENSGVSIELSLSISNQNPENLKRKLECDPVSTELMHSCSKKLKTAESKYDYPNLAVPSATRNLLDSLNKPFFSGVKIKHDEKEEISRVSTELKLLDETWVTSNSDSRVAIVFDPWKVKKKLKASDIRGDQTRLLVPSSSVKEHILPLIGETKEQIEKGIDVRVWDSDTWTLHNMKFKRWSSNSYILKGKWMKEFVVRRELKENDTIGLYWNALESRFHFCVLERAPTQPV